MNMVQLKLKLLKAVINIVMFPALKQTLISGILGYCVN